MLERIKAGATDNHGVFSIGDFQNYLNKELLPAWQVPKKTLPQRARHEDGVGTSTYLQVGWSTARSWALALGGSFDTHKKGYYVDGHDRPDVLEHRKVWLEAERKLELRQYLWVQLTVDEAKKYNVPGYQQVCVDDPEKVLSPSDGGTKIKRRFATQSRRTNVKRQA